MGPQTPQEVRAWLDRLGVGHTAAGQALGLRDPNKTLRSYCSPVGRDTPSDSTRSHMALLETVVLALEQIRRGRNNIAELLLGDALYNRFGDSICRRIATTSGEQNGEQERA